MAPSGLAILIGAGPTTGAGIARMLASPAHGNMAVALLSRTADPSLTRAISKSCYGGDGILKEFKSDTSEAQLARAFEEIRAWTRDDRNKTAEGHELKLTMAVYNVKHSHKTAFEEESVQRYTESLSVYAGGAVAFSQLALKWMLGQFDSNNNDSKNNDSNNDKKLEKKGTIIFTSTLGALRTNAQYAAYGATRASVRMLAQSLAREFSARGVHVVHAIANGGITDNYTKDAKTGSITGGDDAEKIAQGEKMRAESVGRLYLQCALQDCDLWVHELDMRPAAEKF